MSEKYMLFILDIREDVYFKQFDLKLSALNHFTLPAIIEIVLDMIYYAEMLNTKEEVVRVITKRKIETINNNLSFAEALVVFNLIEYFYQRIKRVIKQYEEKLYGKINVDLFADNVLHLKIPLMPF